MQHICSRRDGIRTQIELEPCFFGCGNEAVGRGLVACDVHITAWFLMLRLNAVDIGSTRMGVMAIVVASLNHLDVGFGNGRLLCKFLT